METHKTNIKSFRNAGGMKFIVVDTVLIGGTTHFLCFAEGDEDKIIQKMDPEVICDDLELNE